MVCECFPRILDYLITNCALILIYFLMRRTLQKYRLRMSRAKLTDTLVMKHICAEHDFEN